jgi:hypothetical protein
VSGLLAGCLSKFAIAPMRDPGYRTGHRDVKEGTVFIGVLDECLSASVLSPPRCGSERHHAASDCNSMQRRWRRLPNDPTRLIP